MQKSMVLFLAAGAVGSALINSPTPVDAMTLARPAGAGVAGRADLVSRVDYWGYSRPYYGYGSYNRPYYGTRNYYRPYRYGYYGGRPYYRPYGYRYYGPRYYGRSYRYYRY